MVLEQQFEKTQPGDLGIIGDPIGHSLSPLMHSAALKTWSMVLQKEDRRSPQYHAFQVKPQELAEAVELARRFKLRGINVTVPHKGAVCEHVDRLDPFAKAVGAVNTLVFDSQGVGGTNTDGNGFQDAIELDLEFEAENRSSLVLGAGGTGRVIVAKLLDLGVREIFWWNRSPQRERGSFTNSEPRIRFLTHGDSLREPMGAADLVVNATSVGLSPEKEASLPELAFREGQSVFDVIYHRETEFMRRARERGARVSGGLGMLLYQGAASFRIWMGAPAPVEVMRLALQNAIKKV